MRKIIKGKVYDTDTAHMMGSHAGVYMFKRKRVNISKQQKVRESNRRHRKKQSNGLNSI